MPLAFLGKLIGPVAGYFGKRSDRKRAKETAAAKLQMAKSDNQYKLELTDKEWEAAALNNNQDSWKDEYLTVLITSWMLMGLIGCMYAAITEDTRVLDGVNMFLTLIKNNGIDLGELTLIVVLAGMGLKAIKR